MTMLHTVNKSPFEKDSLTSCLRLSEDGSTILLIEDAIYAALEGTTISDSIKEALKTKKVFALQEDINARGVKNKVIDGIEQVDYAGFVKLVTEHDTVQSWV
ncbi:MAG: sulfurtransferase complex subunit TusB [Gammaproteobacteria bacterium]|nr:sulfurtransferase complex subunit TusB [Gammaproteobacteria bacterium]